MDKFMKSLMLGTACGIINVIPMLLQGFNLQASLATFLHWLALGVIITFARLPVYPWLSGLLIALLTALPLAILFASTSQFSALLILASSAVLGGVLGLTADRLITNPPGQ